MFILYIECRRMGDEEKVIASLVWKTPQHSFALVDEAVRVQSLFKLNLHYFFLSDSILHQVVGQKLKKLFCGA